MRSGAYPDLLEAYGRGPSVLREAIRGVGHGQLASRNGGDAWSIRDLLHHIVDTEVLASGAIRLMLTADNPEIPTIPDEVAFRKLQYLWRVPEVALSTFEQLRYNTAEILAHVDRAGWDRPGRRGGEALTVAAFVASTNDHLTESVGRIAAIRVRLG
jgi:hypothetical protein